MIFCVVMIDVYVLKMWQIFSNKTIDRQWEKKENNKKKSVFSFVKPINLIVTRFLFLLTLKWRHEILNYSFVWYFQRKSHQNYVYVVIKSIVVILNDFVKKFFLFFLCLFFRYACNKAQKKVIHFIIRLWSLFKQFTNILSLRPLRWYWWIQFIWKKLFHLNHTKSPKEIVQSLHRSQSTSHAL